MTGRATAASQNWTWRLCPGTAFTVAARGGRWRGTAGRHLDVEKDLKAAALEGRALGPLQVRRPLVQVVLHGELDVLVLARACARCFGKTRGWVRRAPAAAALLARGRGQGAADDPHCTRRTLLCDASRNSFISRCDILTMSQRTPWLSGRCCAPDPHWDYKP